MRQRFARDMIVLLAAAAAVTGTSAASCGGPPQAGPPASSTTAAPSSSPAPTPRPSTQAPSPQASTSTTLPPQTGPTVPASLLGKDIEVIPTSQRVVALTFDAGANGDGVPSILSTLDAEGITATFFLTGDFAVDFPEHVAAITARGHRLGNHTTTHPHLTTLSDAAVLDEIHTAQAQIRAAGGSDTRPLFRFPYGDRNSHTIALVNSAGYVAVRWTVDTLGWKGTSGGQSAQSVADRVVAAARPGEIVLMHVGSHPGDHSTLDAQALPSMISRLRDLGYSFVTLDVLL
jgi:peptidoglycan/xylan/chitin deacetylase (PgdA/CDA1 family)